MGKELNAASKMLMKDTKATPAPQKTSVSTNNTPAVEYKTERTQIVLRKSTKKALKRIAKKETAGSLNELISRICEDYINNYQE